ncbi:homeobox protein goosecoid-2 isoform X1 [Sagmatias obliquidens]|uniref:homeobox protein goosecoid-2 isoform X1 n=1 Tax=Sagmatias obliquidens TaxID=3371155 RepID=UPI000F441648|nr:homeobox protein goosecoid-2 isoform X1 [Lagenorhynchus obliquidens]
MAAARGAAGRRGPGRPCPFSIEHILSGLPESSPPARVARPPPPAGRQSPAEPRQPEAPEAVPCACCCCCGPRAAPRGSPEPAAGLGARLPWPLRLGPAAPLPLAAPTGGSGAPPAAGGPGSQRRTRRHRTIFSEEQLQALEALFVQNQYPDVGTRERLAGRIRLREERVEVGACSLGRVGLAWRAEAHRPRESRGAGSGSRTAGPSGDTRSAHRRPRGSCREPRSPRRRAADGCRVTPGLGGTLWGRLRERTDLP